MLKPPLFESWTYRRLSPRCFSSSKRLCPKFGRKKCLDFIHYILEFIGDISPTQWIVRYDGGIWWNMDILYLSHVYMIIYIYIPIAVTIEIQTTRLHCDWNQKLWRLHFMESVTLLHDIWVWKWFDVSWCIRNLWPFGWFISPLSKWDI